VKVPARSGSWRGPLLQPNAFQRLVGRHCGPDSEGFGKPIRSANAKTDLYEALEPKLNAGETELLHAALAIVSQSELS
jgi:hypothetical protein